jgi:hypothetical protein
MIPVGLVISASTSSVGRSSRSTGRHQPTSRPAGRIGWLFSSSSQARDS